MELGFSSRDGCLASFAYPEGPALECLVAAYDENRAGLESQVSCHLAAYRNLYECETSIASCNPEASVECGRMFWQEFQSCELASGTPGQAWVWCLRTP